MRQSIATMLFALGLALALPVTAQEQDRAETEPTERSAAVEALPTDLLYGTRWQTPPGIEPVSLADATSPAFADIEFDERSALMRIARLRSLSLLTLGDFGRARLFLGVNDEGLVGLHFNAAVRQADERYLELARMPYVRARKSDNEDND